MPDDATRPSLLRAFLTPRCAIMAALGFASGLPFAIANETASVLLAELKIDRTTIGLLGAIGTVYAFKFLWAPIVDAVPFPGLGRLGRRRSWLVALHLALLPAIASLALWMPTERESPLQAFAFALVIIAVLSATLDIVVNAWTIARFPARELGVGSSMSVTGYRLALLVGGLVALSVAKRAGWPAAFAALAAMQGIGLVAALCAAPDDRPGESDAPSPSSKSPSPSFVERIVAPIVELLQRIGPGLIVVALLVLLFRLPDQLATQMQRPLLLDTLGYEKEQYGVFRNGIGLAATIAGSFLGGAIVVRFGIVRAMLVACVMQAMSNLGFAWIASAVDPLGGVAQPWVSWPMLALTIVSGVESMCGGLVGAVFVAYLMGLCDPRHGATQYALLTSLMALAGGIASAASGYLASSWTPFFLGTVAAGIPGLILVPLAARVVRAAPRSGDAA
jgi:MFS transporter, PAT family, beta-lactamase induction signal transducer AmpG